MSKIEWELIFISPRRQKQTLLLRTTEPVAWQHASCGTNDVRMFLHLTLQPVLQADLLHYAALRFQPVDMFLRILKNFFQNLS